MKPGPVIFLLVACVGFSMTTFGHYADAWPFGYLFSLFAAIIAACCLDEKAR